jgi:hypothetical protein
MGLDSLCNDLVLCGTREFIKQLQGHGFLS